MSFHWHSPSLQKYANHLDINGKQAGCCFLGTWGLARIPCVEFMPKSLPAPTPPYGTKGEDGGGVVGQGPNSGATGETLKSGHGPVKVK